MCLPKRVLLFNEAMVILEAAKDVNNAGISGALDMRTIPSKRPGYFSATPRSCELCGIYIKEEERNEMRLKEMNEMNGYQKKGSDPYLP